MFEAIKNGYKLFTDGTVTNEMTQIHNNLQSYEIAIIKILYKQKKSISFFASNKIQTEALFTHTYSLINYYQNRCICKRFYSERCLQL